MSSTIKILISIACICASLSSFAQTKGKKQTQAKPPPLPVVVLTPMADSIAIYTFNAEDSLSEAFSILMNNYYKYGKFEKPFDAFSGKQGRVFFQELFTPNAMIANDLAEPATFTSQIPIAEYVSKASAKRPRNYELFVEKGKSIVGYPDTVARNYVAEYSFFKLFADKAVYRNPYDLGAIYTFKLRINPDSFDIKIEEVRIDQGNLFQNFSLGGFGFQGDSPFLLTNTLTGLVRNKKEAIAPEEYMKKDTKIAKISDKSKPQKPKAKSERVRKLTKSNITIKAGAHNPQMFSPVMIAQNTNEDAIIRSDNAGQTVGLAYQKTFGKKDNFGWFLGVNYNRFDFKSTYENIGMTYTESPDGNPLFDLEGSEYDFRHVQVANFTDVGYLSFVSPEFGLLFNIHLGPGAHFQFTGSVSHNTITENTSITTGTVSYQGQMDDGGPLVSQESLGFYTDRAVEWKRPYEEMQNFMAYHAGVSINVMLGQKMSIFAEGRYNKSMTYAFREAKNTALPFFDIDEPSWKSPMNFLPESRHFLSYSVTIGLRFYFYEKR